MGLTLNMSLAFGRQMSKTTLSPKAASAIKCLVAAQLFNQ